jgi:putative ABC transport system permease protein
VWRVNFSPATIWSQTPFQQTLRPALAGAGLGLLALIVSVWRASRADVLAFRRRQGRIDRPPLWQRYFLDLGLAALVIAGYVQLLIYGGLETRALLEDAGAAGSFDLIQTLTPSLMMVVGALLILRVTPWLLRLGAWIAARGRGATGMMAFSQLSRASGTFNRLALLLALSVGVGLFALSFQTTLAHTSARQAYYLTGGDERVVITSAEEGTSSTKQDAALFAKMPGVQAVTAIFRSYGVTTSELDSVNVDVLGVDPATFPQVAAWDPADSHQSLATLMAALQAGTQGPNAGDSTHPMPALVSVQFLQSFSLRVGARFQMAPKETLDANPFQFVIVGVVDNFPTMYNKYSNGYIVTDVSDYLAALANPYLAFYPINGPNEFLMKTGPSAAATAQRAKALADPNLSVKTTLDARQLTALYEADPLAAGMTGLLLAGAELAGLLALIALLAQAGAAARQRATQFAVLRTLGMGRGTLLRILLSEQVVTYLTGAIGGIALSVLLLYAAAPFLSFSSSTYQPPVVGVPAPELAFNVTGSAIFLLALLGMFAIALVIAGFVARSSGLGKALRVGED